MYWELAGGKRLGKYGEFALIDSLCKVYAYTHEEAFKLSWAEAMTMIAYTREAAYVDTRAKKIQHEAEKKT